MTRKSLKPLLAVAMTCAIALALAACGSSGSSDGGSGSGQKIVFSTTSLTDPYRVTINEFVEKDAAADGFDLQPTVNAEGDAAKQNTDFSTALTTGVEGIVTIIQDSKAIKPALEQAESKGVPVVALDQGPEEGKVFMTVTTSSVRMGEQVCELLGKNLNGEGKILELQGDLSGAVGRERSEGFEDCMKEKFPGIAVEPKPTEWSQEKATNIAQDVLSTDNSVNGIFLASDSAMLPGVLSVMKRLGKAVPIGQPGHIALATIDGSPFGDEQVRAGYVDGLMSQPLPEYAKWGLYYMQQALAGKTFKPGPTKQGSEIVETPDGSLADILQATLVTKKNADDPKLWGNITQSAE